MKQISIKNIKKYQGSSRSNGTAQGGLYYDGKLYQFADGGNCNVWNADDLTGSPIQQFKLPAYSDSGSNPHLSSVEWIIPGQKIATTTCATGLVNYANKIYIYDISDLDNITQEAVTIQCTDKTKYARMGCLAYDQVNKVMYVAGYTSGSSKNAESPCWFESFDMSGYINNGDLTAPLINQTETDGPGYHMQDGGFYNGYIYYLCDRYDTTNSAYNGWFIWVMNTQFETIELIDVLPGNTAETELFCIMPGTQEGSNCVTFISNAFVGGITFYYTTIGIKEYEAPQPALTLSTSVNVLGYKVNGVTQELDSNGQIILEDGTYEITPIIHEDAVWSQWSDAETTQVRSVTCSSDTPMELTGYAVRETVYLVGAPAPQTKSTSGTSIRISGTLGSPEFIVSTNTSYPNEYMLVSDGLQNDADLDIKWSIDSSNETTYFNENNITDGKYYLTAIPEGYTKIKVSITAGTGEDNTPNSRNPNIIITDGPTATSQMKIYGNTDMKRPLDASVVTSDGCIYDLSAITIANGTTNSYTRRKYGYVFVRLGGNSNRLNNSYATVTFIK